MDFSALKKNYDDDGFVVIRGFLPIDELEQLQSNLDRYIRDVVPQLPDGDAFYEDRTRPETLKQLNRIQQDSYFQEYLRHPRWAIVAESLLGEAAWVHGAEWFNKPPATQHATPPHQDNYYFCLTPPQVLTMWLALDPVDEENGCLRYLKGSHRRGLRPHNRTKTLGFSQGIADYGDEDRASEIPIPAAPGDVLIHHGNTIHRADANRSTSRHRRSFGMVFQAVSCVRDEQAFQQYAESSKQQHLELGLKT
ncbi:MAG: phytanoyl-CoA dioxygenase family protein [Planctomycetes bacterium]|nr:phytanoyl-CoA dioxygenase family protein [Planctomycetota bacterium]